RNLEKGLRQRNPIDVALCRLPGTRIGRKIGAGIEIVCVLITLATGKDTTFSLVIPPGGTVGKAAA
ncbi:MAG TPA: hypothetical protein VH744_14310, partial [Terriglobales bacterium]